MTLFSGWKRMLFVTCSLLLIFSYACGDDGDTTGNTYECPAETNISCMPPVLPENAALCSGDYHNWIVENCPDVQFSY